MSVLRAGSTGRRPVSSVHGFPELAHSWRHQLAALGAAGLPLRRARRPRHGAAAGPPRGRGLRRGRLTGDVVALIDALGAEQAVVIGHDGAPTRRGARRHHPGRVRAVAGLSAPYGAPGAGAAARADAQVPRRGLLLRVVSAARRRRRRARGGRAAHDHDARGLGRRLGAAPRRAADAALHDRRGPRGLRRGLRAHGVHRRPELVPQHRPQLGDRRAATPAARSTSRRCSSPAAATR